MSIYHFDEVVERRNTASVKWDGQKRQYHSSDLTPFGIADMDFEAAPCILEAIRNRATHSVLGYSLPPEGYRECICSWFKKRHQVCVQPEWLIPAQHAVTALAIAFRAVTEPGDACLILTPAYDPFFQVVKGAGREVLMLEMTEREQYYELDIAAMERCFAAGVRCLIFCNPHNPGGKAWKKEELSAIGRLCEQYDVTILSDDVHSDWVYAPWGYTPFISIPEAADRTVLITSPSKTFNVAGLCISNLIIPGETLRSRILQEMSAMFVKGPNLFGYVAAAAAYESAEQWVDEVRDYVYGNILYAKERLSREAPELYLFAAESTFMLWLDCREVEKNSNVICESLAKEYGITVNSGSLYGKGGNGFIRINAACPRSMMKTGIDALVGWYVNQVE